MTTTRPLFTEDDLPRLPDDGRRFELVEGELIQTAPTGYEHGRCTGRLHRLFANPASRTVTINRPPGEITRLTDQDELELGDIVPGLRCRVAEIFD